MKILKFYLNKNILPFHMINKIHLNFGVIINNQKKKERVYVHQILKLIKQQLIINHKIDYQ